LILSVHLVHDEIYSFRDLISCHLIGILNTPEHNANCRTDIASQVFCLFFGIPVVLIDYVLECVTNACFQVFYAHERLSDATHFLGIVIVAGTIDGWLRLIENFLSGTEILAFAAWLLPLYPPSVLHSLRPEPIKYG
jgi:hypothetical protein